MTSWSISVKTVGQSGDFASNDFVINVKPDDDLTSLNDQIEKYTGLKASQQRLIYRGRIIRGTENDFESISNEPKVKDVIGLGDGQTIHLVPRLEPIEQRPVTIVDQETSESSQTESTISGISRTRRPRTPDNDSNPNPGGTASLLAAILGIGGMDNDDPSEEPMSLGQQLARLRSVRARNRNHRPNHRLTQSDLEVQDPGSMEPVRQGLLTLHTMLQGNVQQRKPHRQFYKGQWIDCLDTVNQWLEATIVEIMKPEDLLPSPLLLDSFQESNNLHPSLPTIDPVVSTHDFDGRVRLLLEPSEDPPLDCEWGSYRQRKNNEGVQLLLIHYNGWPHRWDEWVRSDSSRIRLFRTRTRHPTPSMIVSPTPQSHFSDSPPTNIQSEDEAVDRVVLLPELQRIFSSINNHMDSITKRHASNTNLQVRDSPNSSPWIYGMDESIDTDAELSNRINSSLMGDSLGPSQATSSNVFLESTVINSAKTTKPTLKKQLQALVPLLDRLGRTLIDSAPHLAAYAASIPDEMESRYPFVPIEASNVVIADEFDDQDIGEDPEIQQVNSVFSLLPFESNSDLQSPTIPIPSVTNYEPDYVDFINASVNTNRGEIRNRGNRSSTSDSGSLGAFLASSGLNSLPNEENDNSPLEGLGGLGRLLRQRENGGSGTGGIDIHIHAIVTGPSVGGGMAGLALLGEPQVTAPRPNLISSIARRASRGTPQPAATNEGDMGIFSELYSENPTPLDLRDGVHQSDSRQIPSLNNYIDTFVESDNIVDNGATESRVQTTDDIHTSRGTSPTRSRSQSRSFGTIGRIIRRISRRANNRDRSL